MFDIGYATEAAAVPAPGAMDEPGSTAEDGGTQVLVERVKAAHRATAESLRQLGIKHRPEGDEDAREPCLPDFLLWSRPAPVGGREAVIVETMGYALYRERKVRTHALMRRVLRGAPLVQHDFHLPAEQPQVQRDRRFWLECRWAVTGPEIEAGSGANSAQRGREASNF